MIDRFFATLSRLDLGALWSFIRDVVTDPQSNSKAFTLILVAISIVVLLIILLVVIGMMSLPEDEDDEEYEEDDEAAPTAPASVTPAVSSAASEAVAYAPVERTREQKILIAIGWALAFVAIWVIAGAATKQDSVCLSCHITDKVHAMRFKDPKQDPHGNVSCSSCHETSNPIAAVTTSLPGRFIHFGASTIRASLARGYGVPVANNSCANCHQAAIAGTFSDRQRGLLMSHKEPLKARALCTDCHALRPATGNIDRFTVGMEPCLRCHNQQQASSKCSSCHTKDIAYAMQSRGVPEAQIHTSDLNCGGCHGQKVCDNCHKIRMPHTSDFKGSAHGRTAVIDMWYNGGRTCKRCHTEHVMACRQCHTGTFPSHGLAWRTQHQVVDPYNNGCDACHGYRAWMVGRNFCQNCHPDLAKLKQEQLAALARVKADRASFTQSPLIQGATPPGN